MKVGVINQKLIMIRNEETEKNYGNYDTNIHFDKQVVNDFVINNYNHYPNNRIVYNITIKDYLEDFYLIKSINKYEFNIVGMKYNIIGYLKLSYYDGNIEKEKELYISNIENKKEVDINEKIIYTNSELFKLSLVCYNNLEEFHYGKSIYNVEELTIFGVKEEIYPLFAGFKTNIKIGTIKRKILNSSKAYKKYKLALFNRNNELVLKDLYKNKFIHGGNNYEKFYMIEDEIIDPSEYCLTDEVIWKADDKSKKKENIHKIEKNKLKKRIVSFIDRIVDIKKLYIYDDIYMNKNEQYEDITYKFLTKNGSIVEIGGYYLKNKNRYVVSKEILGNVNNYMITIAIVDPFEKILYSPYIDTCKNEGRYKNLKDESWLKADYGYNVQEGTTLTERRNSLERALKDHSKIEIVSLISSFIRYREGNNLFQNAIRRWKEDIKWVNDYKIDKQRKVKIK